MNQMDLFNSLPDDFGVPPNIPCHYRGGCCNDCGWCEGGLVLRGEKTLAEVS